MPEAFAPPPLKLLTTVKPGQLSLAFAGGTLTNVGPEPNTVMLPGHKMVGGVVSLTVKLVLHVDELPAASVAMIVTGCGPQPTFVPAAGDCVSVTPLQLSLATVVAVKSGIAAEQAV